MMSNNMRTSETKKRVVIVGGGFAGIHAYLGLHRKFHSSGDVEIILISERDYFLFTPMIHEVAAGGLLSTNVTQALRSLPRCCISRFIEATLQAADLPAKKVLIRRVNDSLNSEIEEIPYDYLVLALGSDTNFYKTPGAEEYCLTLKNLADALAIKARVIDCFARAEEAPDPETRRQWLTFTIVGGGPTGVELAAELADLIKNECAQNFPRSAGEAKITLIQAGAALVPQVEAWFAKQATKILKKIGVGIRLNSKVREVKSDEVILENDKLPSRVTVWTAGVKAREIEFRGVKDGEIVCDEVTRRLKVNQYLQLASYPEVFIAGDQAWICDVAQQAPYPMRAQFAVREGACVADNLARQITEKKLVAFSWRDAGFIISLGHGRALAKLFGIRLAGPLAWFMYRTAYFFKLFGWRAKLRTALEWTLGLFLPRDISKL